MIFRAGFALIRSRHAERLGWFRIHADYIGTACGSKVDCVTNREEFVRVIGAISVNAKKSLQAPILERCFGDVARDVGSIKIKPATGRYKKGPVVQGLNRTRAFVEASNIDAKEWLTCPQLLACLTASPLHQDIGVVAATNQETVFVVGRDGLVEVME